MSHFNFVIPSKREELLIESDDYYVKNIIGPRELLQKQKGLCAMANIFVLLYNIVSF